MSTFTPDDLLLYLYDDMDAATRLQVEEQLEKDWTLREKLAVLKTAKERLNRITESPRTEVILSVMHKAAEQMHTILRS
jgi:anti-sigma factor RsiW